jgi:hypothetical protein
VDELERVAALGARTVKWLPNAMGINPGSPRCDAFYRKMAELKMPLHTHAGEEQAVEAEEAQALGNPLHLRRALDAGVKVVVAHAASLGTSEDLDKPGTHVSNFELWLRLMEERRSTGLVYADFSALTQYNRCGEPLRKLLTREIPASPDIGYACVDVRDVAQAHLAAMTTPTAAGQRFVVAIEHAAMIDIARILDRHFRPRGFRVPTGRLPSWLLRVVAIWDKTARLGVQGLGKRQDVSAAKARDLLGWQPHSLEEMVVAMGETMVKYGVVRA